MPSVTETVVSRLHDAVERTKANPDLPSGLVIEFLDGVDLLNLITALCPEHGSCSNCKAPLCSECRIGERSPCDHGEILCDECTWTCRVCCAEAGLVNYEPHYRRL